MKTTATLTKHYSYLLAFILFSTSYLFAGNPTKPIAPLLKAKADAGMEQTKQLGFQENNGQIVDTDGKQANNVLYKAEAPGINIWVTKSGLSYQFLKFEEEKKESKAKKEESELANPIAIDDNMKVTWHGVDMVLKNAIIKKENILIPENLNLPTLQLILPKSVKKSYFY